MKGTFESWSHFQSKKAWKGFHCHIAVTVSSLEGNFLPQMITEA